MTAKSERRLSGDGSQMMLGFCSTTFLSTLVGTKFIKQSHYKLNKVQFCVGALSRARARHALWANMTSVSASQSLAPKLIDRNSVSRSFYYSSPQVDRVLRDLIIDRLPFNSLTSLTPELMYFGWTGAVSRVKLWKMFSWPPQQWEYSLKRVYSVRLL